MVSNEGEGCVCEGGESVCLGCVECVECMECVWNVYGRFSCVCGVLCMNMEKVGNEGKGCVVCKGVCKGVCRAPTHPLTL